MRSINQILSNPKKITKLRLFNNLFNEFNPNYEKLISELTCNINFPIIKKTSNLSQFLTFLNFPILKMKHIGIHLFRQSKTLHNNDNFKYQVHMTKRRSVLKVPR